MGISRLFATATFRLAITFALVFAAGATVILLALEWSTKQYALQSTDDALRAEMTLFRGERAQSSSEALARDLEARRRSAGGALHFLIIGPDGHVRGGDLTARAASRMGFGQVKLPAPVDAREYDTETMTVRTLTQKTRDGSIVVVGRDTYARDELDEWLGTLTLLGGVAMTVVAMCGGLVVGRLFLNRLDTVNSTVERIMAGRLDERIPSIGFGDEFDRLCTGLNRMLDRLSASLESQRQISTDIAHDLRTPLTLLRQRLEWASARPGSVDQYKAVIDAALADLDEVLDIFLSLLRLAKLEGRAALKEFSSVDLNDVLNRVVDIFGPAAEERDHKIQIAIAPGLRIVGDAVLLGQLFCNLLENAIIHCPPGAVIRIDAEPEGAELTVTVADDGPGVPPAELAQITRRFYRVDRSRTTPGSGLGLSLSAAIAELHGFPLRLRDNNPGLRIDVRLPLDSSARRATASPGRPPTHVPARSFFGLRA